MARFELSLAAADDLEDIDRFTRERFGLEQASRQRERFHKALKSLASAPMGAPGRPDYDPPGKSFRYSAAVRSFVIVYEPDEDGIRVARILHGGRDLARELERHAGGD